MACSRLLDLLADYLEGRLPEAVHASLERHLTGCSDCVAYLRTYRTTVALLGSLTEDELPLELRTRLRAFLDANPEN